MAEAEAAPAALAAAPADAAGAAGPRNGRPDQDPEARFRYSEELLELVKVKGKPRPPQPPNEAEKKLQIQKLQEEVDKRSARIKDIKAGQEAARSRGGASGSQNSAFERLAGLKAQFSAVVRQKQAVREQVQEVGRQRQALLTQLRALKDKLPQGLRAASAAESVERQLQDLEFKLAHESNQDEKALHRRIQELSAARPTLREVAALEAQLKQVSESRDSLMAKLQESDKQLDGLNASMETEKQGLDAQKSSQAAAAADQPNLNAEKAECWDIIQALRAKMREVHTQFNEKVQEYNKLDRNYNNYVRFIKRKEWQERQKAREEQAAAAQAEAEASGGAGAGGEAGKGGAGGGAGPVVQPYAAEQLTLDQLLAWLRKLLPADEPAKASEAGGPAQGKGQVEVPQGMKPMRRKDDDDGGGLSVAKKKPAQGKGRGGGGEPGPSSAPGPSRPAEPKRKLHHPLEMLQAFMQFGIEVPQMSTDLAATIQKVEGKKQYFADKGQREAEARANGTYVPPAATTSAAAAADGASGSGSSGAGGSAGGPEAAPSNGSEPAAPAGGAAAPQGTCKGVGLTLHVDQASQQVTVGLKCT